MEPRRLAVVDGRPGSSARSRSGDAGVVPVEEAATERAGVPDRVEAGGGLGPVLPHSCESWRGMVIPQLREVPQ